MSDNGQNVNMKFILSSLILAIIGLLCGCASLGSLMQPRDPNVVSAEASASSAEKWVSTFLQFVQANPQLGLAEKGAAENLERQFDPDLKNLHRTLDNYRKYPMANQGPLSDARQRVEAHEAVARRLMNGGEIRGQGAPFAPPLVIGSPGSQPTALDSILERLDGIRGEQVSQRAELTIIRTNLGRLGHAVWSMTNKTTVTTNAPPKKPNE